MNLKEYAPISERVKAISQYAKPASKRTYAALPSLPSKIEKKMLSDTPDELRDKLHQLPDKSIEQRLINLETPKELDEEALFAKFLKRIQSEKLIDISHIGNMQTFMWNRTKYGMHEMMHGGASSNLSFMTPTGTVNGVNTAFVFSSAPSLIVVDQGRAMQKTSSDGTVNWTGTTSITLTVAPTFDIYGL